MKKAYSTCCTENTVASSKALKSIQYIKLSKERTFNDLSGRTTTLVKGAVGYIIDEEEIKLLCEGIPRKKQTMLDEMKSIHERGGVYALILGYPCSLVENEYIALKTQPLHCIGELI